MEDRNTARDPNATNVSPSPQRMGRGPGRGENRCHHSLNDDSLLMPHPTLSLPMNYRGTENQRILSLCLCISVMMHSGFMVPMCAKSDVETP
jgi:hypothetical protein